MNKGVGNEAKFDEVEARVGMTGLPESHGLVPVTGNTQCGARSPENSQLHHLFNCNPAITGQFVTLQVRSDNYLGMDSVTIYKSGIDHEDMKSNFSLINYIHALKITAEPINQLRSLGWTAEASSTKAPEYDSFPLHAIDQRPSTLFRSEPGANQWIEVSVSQQFWYFI